MSRGVRVQKITSLVQRIQTEDTNRKIALEHSPPPVNSMLYAAKRESRRLDDLETLLLEQQAAIERDIARSHNSMQPIFRLPTEVLAQIAQTVASFLDGTLKASLRPSATRLPLSQSFFSFNLACRRMRTIAADTPRCWTNVVVLITDESVTLPNVLKGHLRRSKGCLFRLIIYVNAMHSSRAMLRNVLSSIGPHAPRCRYIELCSGLRRFELAQVAETIRDLHWNYPSLRQVKFLDNTQSPNYEDIRFAPFWTQTDAQIESFDMEFQGGDEVLDPELSLNDLQLPENTLKRLRIHAGLSKLITIGLARRCGLLEYFEWYSEEDDPPIDTEPLLMPCLKTLRLAGPGLMAGFPPFNAPVCEQICAHEIWEESRMWDEEAEWFLFRTPGSLASFPRLKRISLFHPGGFTPKLRDFLLSHPLLEEILIRRPNFEDDRLTWIHGQFELFDGLALADINRESPQPMRQVPFLPSLRIIWYEPAPDQWNEWKYFTGYGAGDKAPNGFIVAMVNAISRLLVLRASVTVNLRLSLSEDKEIPQEIRDLSKKYGERLVVSRGPLLLDWEKL
ncbi:hypothetical protein DL93DRAFT_2170952 [Clavulina sp. PMI_390]|nr:hypothetical protein DL93DRAFT_2170952 [Clavulina sp. PMI_390]